LSNNVAKVHSGKSVFCGVGERTREGNDLYLEMKESKVIDSAALIYGQMNEPPGARLRVGLSGLTVAEYFRDEEHADVLVFIDNIFRFTQAGSEVSALLGRMPSAVGYQPTLANEMGDLQERITSTRNGSITSVQAIYVPADDLTDPAPATAFAHLDATVVLLTPVFALRLDTSDAGNDPTTQTTRQAYDLLAKGFGPGVNGPLQLAVALPRPGDTASVGQLTQAVRHTPGIASVAPPRVNATGTAAAILAYPTTSPQSAQTSQLVARLRASVIPSITRDTGARVYVGGATASEVDFSHVLSTKLPLFIAIVIALAALLLVVVFRSLVIPVQAALMNLLSIGASLGVIQAVFERGWLSSLFGTGKGPIDAFIPVLAFAIVFGLSMDYEVFLISRVHEEWESRRDASAAVREGLAHTGRVITAAAAVMVAVFGGFAISGSRTLAMFGLAMASAVLLDALVVRMLLLPAVLQLLGRITWALPRWLDRRLPRLAIEASEPDRGSPRRPLEPALDAGS